MTDLLLDKRDAQKYDYSEVDDQCQNNKGSYSMFYSLEMTHCFIKVYKSTIFFVFNMIRLVKGIKEPVIMCIIMRKMEYIGIKNKYKALNIMQNEKIFGILHAEKLNIKKYHY